MRLSWPSYAENYPQRLQLSYLQGFSSEILRTLAQQNFDIRYFNAEKLEYYINSDMVADGTQDPWNYQQKYLLERISNLSIQWYDSKKAIVQSVDKFPSGTWQELAALKQPFTCQSPTCEQELSLGLHYFIRLTDYQLLQVQLRENQEAEIWLN